ncbi:NEDD8-activating enzyme E1 catalytic subunit [Nannizzia gypsea CBS 118893]|uniref:NEDD8-activating enzyme E1 catalytic subunit n=1 Tax=Arthroderma gypseum (strain ATCC MYA-4604 / CBS 118893) TaxID=535722 RepID=E4V0M8_ARTGP|nr:NEDD8-activating enzyme E1 catalytic subunit [Nannizzia gypsea CBS 118893]EFR03165.1 NEDD8-activating enzyme E1 catalytic subunit [Nannizzia gypsea CBS 118893]
MGSSMPDGQASDRWRYLHRVLTRSGPYSDPDWVPGPETIAGLESSKILGAGGLGCEILKNLALSGFKDIHVIDMDTIDISNLNRQFLFRQADVGKPKAEVAAAFVEKRVKGVKITPFVGKIQDKDEEYYMQFKIIVCGLDSIEARRWINSMAVGMVDPENPESLKPLIDGGTEGFKGQARVILPTLTSCIECQLDMHAPRAAVPLCTIATIPRQPQHCIEWAHQIAWGEQRKGEDFDGDDLEHVTWIYQTALERAKQFSIPGVTFSMSQGVVKNIIPAIASTNAVIAAACTSEALKIATSCNPYLENYMMYAGEEGVYTYTFAVEQKEDCPVCGNLAKTIEVSPESTLEQFIESLGERAEAQLKSPSLRTEQTTLYQRFPPQLEEQTRHNLQKKLKDLLESGEEVAVSDPAFTIDFRFKLVF